MDKLKRLLFQVLLWFAVWIVLWVDQQSTAEFLRNNGSAFLFQIILIAGLIFYFAPALLFKKKYLIFIGLSLTAIALAAYFTSWSAMPPPQLSGPPPLNAHPRRPISPPPSLLIHFLLLSVSYMLAIFIEAFIFAQRKEQEIISNKSESLQTELKFLKSQINPHFLFNSLNNIYALSVIDSNRTQQSISSLSNMLRYVLYECDQAYVPIHKEIAYIDNYLELFCLKSSKEYPIDTNFNILDKNVSIAPMIFIPFVENALKHGNIENRADTFLRISIFSDNKEVKFEIENSVSEVPKQKDAVGGIGLENVKKRLNILYPQRHKLAIESLAKSFKITLKIDLHGNH